MRPQDNRSLQDINLPLSILLPYRQVELLRRVGFIPAPQEISALVTLFIVNLYISMEKVYFFSNSKYLFSRLVMFLLKVAF